MNFRILTYFALTLLVSCNGGDDGPSESANSLSSDDMEKSTYDLAQCSMGDKSIRSSGDPLLEQSWHFKKINMPETWPSGAGVTIAVSDNGTEVCHEDLKQNIKLSLTRNYRLDDPSSWRSDPLPNGTKRINAHGTSVTGIIGAKSDNGLGSRGVASGASLVPFRYVGTKNTLDRAIDQAHGPFDIFNYSYGRSTCKYNNLPSSLLDQFKYGATKLRGGLGSFYVKASGNDFVRPLSDCIEIEGEYYFFGNANMESDNNTPYTIVVGANSESDYSSSYSTPGSNLWISAPGGEFGLDTRGAAIIAPDLMGCSRGFSSEMSPNKLKDEDPDCKYTEFMNGTSSAAPIVSGVIALILEKNKNLAFRDVKDILARSARKIDSSLSGNLLRNSKYNHWVTNAAGISFNNFYGFGAVDVKRALELVDEKTHHLPPMIESGFLSSTDGDKRIPDNTPNGVTSSIGLNQDLKIEAVQIAVTIISDDKSRVPQDIGIELTSPSGTVSQIIYVKSGILDTNFDNYIFLSNAFYDEKSEGNWTLRVIDGAKNDTGVLKNWKINVIGHDPEVIGKEIKQDNPPASEPTIAPTPSSGENGSISNGDVLLEDVGFNISSTSDRKIASKTRTLKKLSFSQRRIIFPINFVFREKADVYEENHEGSYLVIDNGMAGEVNIIKVNQDGDVLVEQKIYGKDLAFHDVIQTGENYVLLGNSKSLVFDINDIEQTNYTHTVVAKMSNKLALIKGHDVFANKEIKMSEKIKKFSVENKTLKLDIEKDGIPKEMYRLDLGGFYE